ncbi:metalloproteinase inhibitor 1-like [Lissotriton helveticus]
MDTRKWVTLLAGVLFVGALAPAEACKCIINHLQRSNCNSEIVLKLKIHEATTQAGDKGYKVEVVQVLKGIVKLKTLKFITIMNGTDCEYFHPSTDFHKDYLITASNISGKVSVSSCSYSVRWDELSHNQKKGVEGAYYKGCSCAIESCATPRCSTAQKTCTIDEYNGGDAKKQLKNKFCVPVNTTTCQWKEVY